MPFSDELKLAVKRRAHFMCCLCRSLYVEVHHIIPEAKEGPDTEDNAAPLCPSCHEKYGANPTKRKFIREARDLWYDICVARYTADFSQMDQLAAQVKQLATKDDLQQGVAALSKILKDMTHQPGRSTIELTRKVSDETASSTTPTFPSHSTASLGRTLRCQRCGAVFQGAPARVDRCPWCKQLLSPA